MAVSPSHTGMAVVATCALLSVIACASFLGYVAFLGVRVLRPKRSSKSDAGIFHADTRFVYSQFGALFLNLVFADLLQALGFGMNLHWLGTATLPPPGVQTMACSVQGSLIQIGDSASAIWVMIIGIHTAAVLGFRMKISKWILASVVPTVWLGMLAMASVVPWALARNGGDAFYGNAGSWCWIAAAYEQERIYLHYLIIFVVIFVNFIIYGSLFFLFRRRSRSPRSPQANDPRFHAISSKMLLYPIAYLVVVLPLSVYRIAGFCGHKLSPNAQCAVGSVFTLAGLVNVALYTTTRTVVSKPALPATRESMWPRSSFAAPSFSEKWSQNLHSTPFAFEESADFLTPPQTPIRSPLRVMVTPPSARLEHSDYFPTPTSATFTPNSATYLIS